MELGQLEAFARAAHDGSFTRAAETLNLTQPAISARIALLETELGGPLFERGGRQLQLTPLGRHFLPYAERMLAVLADGLQAVENFQAGKVGQVKIAAPGPFVIGLLVDVLEVFRQEHPTVDVLIRERAKTTILDMLYDGVLALGLVNAPVFDDNMTVLARLRDPIRAVVAPSHSLARRAPSVRMEALYQHTIFRVSMFPRMSAFIDSLVEHGRAGSGGAVIGVPMIMALRLATLGQGGDVFAAELCGRAGGGWRPGESANWRHARADERTAADRAQEPAVGRAAAGICTPVQTALGAAAGGRVSQC